MSRSETVPLEPGVDVLCSQFPELGDLPGTAFASVSHATKGKPAIQLRNLTTVEWSVTYSDGNVCVILPNETLDIGGELQIQLAEKALSIKHANSAVAKIPPQHEPGSPFRKPPVQSDSPVARTSPPGTSPARQNAAPAPEEPPGRFHSPLLALFLALAIPGAGQAYNGQAIRAFFVPFLTPLVIPWVISVWGAWASADRIRREGGRYEKGGFIWVVLQAWLVANIVLMVFLVLTITGHLQ